MILAMTAAVGALVIGNFSNNNDLPDVVNVATRNNQFTNSANVTVNGSGTMNSLAPVPR